MTFDPFDLASRFAASSGSAQGETPAENREAEDQEEEGKQVTDPRGSDEAAYVCDACGEEIVVPVDPAAGAEQEYVEDCPVCCRPNLLSVTVEWDGAVRCTARPE